MGMLDTIQPMPKVAGYQLKELHARHREIIRMHVSGLKAVQIAEELGVCEESVCHTLHGELGQAQIRELQALNDSDAADTDAVIKALVPQAVQVYRRCMLGLEEFENAAPTTRLKAAEKFWDQDIPAPIKRVATLSATLSKEDIEDIKRVAFEEVGVIDIEPRSEAVVDALDPLESVEPVEEL